VLLHGGGLIQARAVGDDDAEQIRVGGLEPGQKLAVVLFIKARNDECDVSFAATNKRRRVGHAGRPLASDAHRTKRLAEFVHGIRFVTDNKHPARPWERTMAM